MRRYWDLATSQFMGGSASGAGKRTAPVCTVQPASSASSPPATLPFSSAISAAAAVRTRWCPAAEEMLACSPEGASEGECSMPGEVNQCVNGVGRREERAGDNGSGCAGGPLPSLILLAASGVWGSSDAGRLWSLAALACERERAGSRSVWCGGLQSVSATPAHGRLEH